MKKYLLLASCLISMPVLANWQFLVENNNVRVYYFNKESYKTIFGGSEIVQMIDLKSPDIVTTDRRGTDEIPQKESYLSIRSMFEIDCKKKQERILNIKYYSGQMGKGLLVNENKSKSEWFGLDSKKAYIVCNK